MKKSTPSAIPISSHTLIESINTSEEINVSNDSSQTILDNIEMIIDTKYESKIDKNKQLTNYNTKISQGGSFKMFDIQIPDQKYSGNLTLSDNDQSGKYASYAPIIQAMGKYQKLSRDIFMTRADKSIRIHIKHINDNADANSIVSDGNVSLDKTIAIDSVDSKDIMGIYTSSISPEKIRRCVEGVDNVDNLEGAGEDENQNISEKINTDKKPDENDDNKENKENTEIKIKLENEKTIINDKDDQCPVCKIAEKTKEIIEKIEKIMEVDNTQETINTELQTLTVGASNVLDTIDIDSNTTSTCIVDKLISHISRGGEAAGVHLGLFRVNTVIKMDDSSTKTLTKYKICTIKVIPIMNGGNERDITRGFKYSSIKNHSHIIKHIISYESEKYVCLVNEYIDGHSLEDIIDHHKLNNSIKITIVKQIYSGLRALHKEGYLHLDIKPGNIILCADPEKHNSTIKIIDFGKSVQIDNRQFDKIGEIFNCDEKFKRKFLKNVFSTPVYICPNIVLDDKYTSITCMKEMYYFGILCDLWAFGMTIYEIFVDEPYYDKNLMYGKLFRRMTRELKKNPQLNIHKLINNKEYYGLPDDFVEVLNLCLKHRPFSSDSVQETLSVLNRIDAIML